jgi:hypothetical protein
VNGFRDLTQILFDAGVVLDPDWVFPFQQALSISADGSVLHDTGTQNSFGSVPGPAAGALALAALATLALLAARSAAAASR